MKFIKEVAEEKRKIRWSGTNKSTRIFLATLVTIICFVVIIGLFSWGIAEIMALAV